VNNVVSVAPIWAQCKLRLKIIIIMKIM